MTHRQTDRQTHTQTEDSDPGRRPARAAPAGAPRGRRARGGARQALDPPPRPARPPAAHAHTQEENVPFGTGCRPPSLQLFVLCASEPSERRRPERQRRRAEHLARSPVGALRAWGSGALGWAGLGAAGSLSFTVADTQTDAISPAGGRPPPAAAGAPRRRPPPVHCRSLSTHCRGHTHRQTDRHTDAIPVAGGRPPPAAAGAAPSPLKSFKIKESLLTSRSGGTLRVPPSLK